MYRYLKYQMCYFVFKQKHLLEMLYALSFLAINSIINFSTDSFFLHGNSFHGTGGRGNKFAQMRYTLRLLRAMVYLEDETVNTDLCERGVIHQLIGKVLHGSSLVQVGCL